MHKVVINRSYGGYGLSPLATYEICKRKGKDCYIYAESESDSSEYIKASPTSNYQYWYALNKDFGNTVSFDDIPCENYIGIEDLPRHDKDLVAVVEELGDKANGYCADLKVVEINSNLYRIKDYDGAESIETPEDINWVKVED